MRTSRRASGQALSTARGALPSRKGGGSRRLRVQVPASAANPAVACGQADACLVQQAIAGLSIGMILTDPAGRLMWLNRAAERLFGLVSQEAVGRPITKVLRDPELRRVWEQGGCREGNCLADLAISWPRKLELKLNITNCRTRTGKLLGRALLFCDVTEERSVQVRMSRDVARRLLDLSGSPGEPPAAVASLTPQELRTLRLLGTGKPNHEIAAGLSIERSTVRAYLKSLYRKLGLRSRAAAISFAVHHHLA